MVVIRVGIQLQNYSGPLRYVIEEFDVRIGSGELRAREKGAPNVNYVSRCWSWPLVLFP